MKFVRNITLTDSMLIASSIAEDDYPEWSAGDTFAAGGRCIQAASHRVFESITNGNIGNDPAADVYDSNDIGTNWIKVGATNRWRAFDDAVSDKASAADSITFTLAPGRINSVVLFGLEAATVHVQMIDGAVTVYDKTKSLLVNNRFNWYDYFFEPIVRAEQVSFLDLPQIGAATVDITVSSVGGTVKVGEVVLGIAREIGKTQWGSTRGVVDFSIKTVLPSGRAQLKQLGFVKRRSAAVLVKRTHVDEMTRLMESMRGKLTAWIISDLFSEDIIYGWPNDFEFITDRGPDGSLCSLQIEGLS